MHELIFNHYHVTFITFVIIQFYSNHVIRAILFFEVYRQTSIANFHLRLSRQKTNSRSKLQVLSWVGIKNLQFTEQQ